MSRHQASVWERFDEMEVRLSAPLSERMLALAEVERDDVILDLASGRGEPAIRAARLADRGHVIATDRSGEILKLAKRRAAREGVANVSFAAVDAEKLDCLRGTWADAALCRWGLMYFDSPRAALGAVRRLLRPEGLFAIAVWADVDRVPYLSVPRAVLSRYAPLDPVDLSRPGPTYYGAADRLPSDLGRAGFEVLHQEELDVPVMEASTEDDLVDWVLAFGSGAVKTLPPLEQHAWRADLVAAASSHRVNGVVRLGGITRIVIARPG